MRPVRLEPDLDMVTYPLKYHELDLVLFVEEASETFQQTTKADDFCVIGAVFLMTK